MNRVQVIERINQILVANPEQDNRDLEGLLIRLNNFPDCVVSYCEGGEEGTPFHSSQNGADCSTCRANNSYSAYGCIRNKLGVRNVAALTATYSVCDSVSNMITVSRVLRIAVRFALANIDEFKKFVERDIE